jgi:hypothetical protein
MSPIRKIAAVASTLALVGTAGLGVANAADQTASGSSTTGTTRPAPPRGGPGLTSAQLDAIAAKLGVTSAKLQSAIAADRPARPSGSRRGERGDGMAAELATALGADASKVAAILDANRPARPAAGTAPSSPGQRPSAGGPDKSTLIAALASGLGLDQATVKAAFDKLDAAHEAEHQARDNARYAALAKTLGVDADKVAAAFEAVRPAKPAGR